MPTRTDTYDKQLVQINHWFKFRPIRFFEMGLSIHQVVLISGHKDVKTSMRYTHLRALGLVQKFNWRIMWEKSDFSIRVSPP